MLAESSGAQTRFTQTLRDLTLASTPRLGHAEWADSVKLGEAVISFVLFCH